MKWKNNMDELRRILLESTITVYGKKGMSFTMSDIAEESGVSKKTIYCAFNDKSSLCDAMVDYIFDGIKESERQVVEDETLSTIDKVKRILGAMPDAYSNINFSHLHVVREKYPAVYLHMKNRLENGWEDTIGLIEKGIEEGVIRPIRIEIFKLMYESTLEAFLSTRALEEAGITYAEAFHEMVDVLMEGIRA